MTYAELGQIAATRQLSPGDQVQLEGVGACEVLDNSDPAMLTLVAPSGARLKAGRLAVPVERRNGG